MISRDIQKVPEDNNALRVFLRKTLREHYKDIRDIYMGNAVLEALKIETDGAGTGTDSSDQLRIQSDAASNPMYLKMGVNDANIYSYIQSTQTTIAHKGLVLQPLGGNVGIGTTEPSAKLDVNSDIFRLRNSKTPASAGADGNQGDICWDSDYVYICVADNTWKRSGLSSW